MEFELSNAISILERTPLVLKALLKDMPDAWTHQNEGKDTWSPFDVLGHLIHGERTDWIPRTKIIMGNDPDKKFEPFDRFAQFENSKGKTMNQLLEEFERFRNENIDQLKSMQITTQDLLRKGLHPQFGKITLKQMLSTWVAHDLAHIAQISRVMARQYKSEVGPWYDYLNILKSNN